MKHAGFVAAAVVTVLVVLAALFTLESARADDYDGPCPTEHQAWRDAEADMDAAEVSEGATRDAALAAWDAYQQSLRDALDAQYGGVTVAALKAELQALLPVTDSNRQQVRALNVRIGETQAAARAAYEAIVSANSNLDDPTHIWVAYHDAIDRKRAVVTRTYNAKRACHDRFESAANLPSRWTPNPQSPGGFEGSPSVNQNPSSFPLRLPAVSSFTWVVDDTVSETLPAASGGAAVRYTLDRDPPGLTFDADTRTLTGTAGTATTTTHLYRVVDRFERVQERTFTVTINPALSLRTLTSYTFTVGTNVSETLPAATGGIAPYRYSLEGTLPAGVRFSAASRRLSGRPTAEFTTTSFTYTVTDRDGRETFVNFSITVDPRSMFQEVNTKSTSDNTESDTKSSESQSLPDTPRQLPYRPPPYTDLDPHEGYTWYG